MTSPEAKDTIRVLIVDDVEDDFAFISRLLQRSNMASYQASWASSVAEARQLLRAQTFDAALVDYRLKETDGMALLRESEDLRPRVPIILLTGADSPEIDREAVRAGAADYLCKGSLTTERIDRSIRYTVRQFQAQKLVREASLILEGMLSHLPLIVARVDGEGILREWRGSGLARLGLPERDAAGRQVADAFPAIMPAVEPALKGGIGRTVWTMGTWENPASFEVTFFFDAQRGAGAIGLLVDVTDRMRAEMTVRRQSELLSSLIDHLPVIVGRLDAEGRVAEVAGSGLRRLKMSAEDLVGQEPAKWYPEILDKLRRARASEAVNFTLEGGEGADKWIHNAYVFGDSTPGQGYVFFSVDVTEQRQIERQMLQALEEERQRIGRDLHDGLGQYLTGVACLSSALEQSLRGKRSLAEQAAIISRRVNEAIEQTRALSRGLCPVQVETTGLCSALGDLAYTTQKLHATKCSFQADPDNEIFDNATAVQLYRIAQEAVTNALRHAKASRINIELVKDGGGGILRIYDDGIGLQADNNGGAAGIGMSSMRHRASLIGGSLEVSTRNGEGGTVVECRYPNTERITEHGN